MRGYHRQAETSAGRVQLTLAAAIELQRAFEKLVIVDGRQRRRLRQDRRIERRPHALQQGRGGRRHDAVAEPHPGQPVCLGHAAHQNQVALTGGDPRRQVGERGRLGELPVHFVMHQHHALRQLRQQPRHGRTRKQRAGRIVRVADEHHPGAPGDPLQHAGRGEAQVRHRHLGHRRSLGQRHRTVHVEGNLRHQHFVPGTQERQRRGIEHGVGPVAGEHALRRDRVGAPQGVLQQRVGNLGIAVGALQRRAHGGGRLGADAERVFVGRELDDVGQPQFPRHLLDGASRHVRGDLHDAGRGVAVRRVPRHPEIGGCHRAHVSMPGGARPTPPRPAKPVNRSR